MKKDVKTIDQLLNQIQTIRADVHEFHQQTERLMKTKDMIIELLERQKAIYKRDLNIMFWICAILATSAIGMYMSIILTNP
jgi:uncharacterized protein (UPF0305 family)